MSNGASGTTGRGLGGIATGAASGGISGAMAGPVGIAIGAGVGAIGSIFGAKSQTKAASKAAAVEDKYHAQALDAAREERDYTRQRETEARDYGRSQRAGYLERLQPYRAVGTTAIQRLDRGLAGNMSATVPTNSTATGFVQMRAPNGIVKAVPAAHVPHFEALGAQRV